MDYFIQKNLTGRDHVKYQGSDERIILKSFIKLRRDDVI
jgi:hypothetical protein